MSRDRDDSLTWYENTLCFIAENGRGPGVRPRKTLISEDIPLSLTWHLTVDRWLNVVAAVLGSVGGVILFKWSFAFESLPFYDNRAATISKALGLRNRRRQVMQRVGLALILASFVVQGIAQFVDP
jgi:hypothetical protein